MNKIFKIIWSKTRNCYVVVSEMAKQKGKCSSSLNKKIIAAFLAAGTVMSVTGSAWAATPEEIRGTGSGSIAIGVGGSGYAPNPDYPYWDFRDYTNMTSAVATALNTIAIGTAAQAISNDAIDIGPQSLASQKNAVAVGWRALATGGDSVAYGDHAYALEYQATAIGSNTKSYNLATTSVGAEANATYYELSDTTKFGSAFGAYSAVGNSYGGTAVASYSWVDNSVYGASFGTKASVQNSVTGTALGSLSLVNNNPGGVALGAQAISERNGMAFSSALSDPYYGTDREAKGGYDLSLADKGYVHPSANVLELIEAYKKDKTPEKKAELMDALTWNSTDGVVSVGTFMDGKGPEYGVWGATDKDVFVTRQITGVAAGSADTDAVNVAQLKMVASAIEKMEVDTDNRNVGLIDNEEGKREIVSPYLEIQGIENASQARQIVQDYDAKKAELEAAKQALVDADEEADTSEIDSQIAALTDSYNAAQITFENYAKATGDAAIALGKASVAKGADTVALGSYSEAQKDGSVALGSGSIADREAGWTGLNPLDVPVTAQDLASPTWTSTDAAVSVGGGTTSYTYLSTNEKGQYLDADGVVVDSPEKAAQLTASATRTRQITNVAAGTKPTDAVNVAQLQGSATHYYSVDERAAADTLDIADSNYNNTGATGAGSMAAGYYASAPGEESTAFGYGSQSTDRSSSSLGSLSKATSKFATAVGHSAQALGENSTAAGTNSVAAGLNSTAVGLKSEAFGQGTIAIGHESTAGALVKVVKSPEGEGINEVYTTEVIRGGDNGEYIFRNLTEDISSTNSDENTSGGNTEPTVGPASVTPASASKKLMAVSPLKAGLLGDAIVPLADSNNATEEESGTDSGNSGKVVAFNVLTQKYHEATPDGEGGYKIGDEIEISESSLNMGGIAIGSYAHAEGYRSMSIGRASGSYGEDSTAVGIFANAMGKGDMALGHGASTGVKV
ncbi:MAG: hypothetical protein IJ858_08000 [Acidaminococcaceae bacterium]|nr:hypothetical protein [Acidaminococcaceae bacterium]